MPIKPLPDDSVASRRALFEITTLGAVALDMVDFADQLPLGQRAAAQTRDLRWAAGKARSYVSKAECAEGSAKRRRTAYERAYECVAVFAFVLIDLLQGEHIAREDFDEGRRLAARAKALLDPHVGVTTVRIAATVVVPTPGLPPDPRRDRN